MGTVSDSTKCLSKKSQHTLNKVIVVKFCGTAPRKASDLWLVLQTYMTSALYNLFYTKNVQEDLIFITDFWGNYFKFILFTAWDKNVCQFQYVNNHGCKCWEGGKKQKQRIADLLCMNESHPGTSRFTINLWIFI